LRAQTALELANKSPMANFGESDEPRRTPIKRLARGLRGLVSRLCRNFRPVSAKSGRSSNEFRLKRRGKLVFKELIPGKLAITWCLYAITIAITVNVNVILSLIKPRHFRTNRRPCGEIRQKLKSMINFYSVDVTSFCMSFRVRLFEIVAVEGVTYNCIPRRYKRNKCKQQELIRQPMRYLRSRRSSARFISRKCNARRNFYLATRSRHFSFSLSPLD